MFSAKPRRVFITLLVALIASTFILPGHAFSSLEEKIKESQQKLGRVEKNLRDRGEKLNEYKSEEKKLESDLANLESRLQSLQRELDRLEREIRDVTANIELKERELAEAEEQVELRDAFLKKRLRAIYEEGDAGYLEVLFEVDSFAEFITRLNDLKLIAENDLDLLELAFDEKMAIEAAKEELEEEKARLQNLEAEQVKNLEELRKQQAAREELLKVVQENIDAQEKAIRELEQESQKIETLIQQLQIERHSQTNQYTPSGDLLWPLAEYGTSWITSGYGARVHPITGQAGTFHGGVDIGIPHSRWPGSHSYNGNPVYIRAADNGVVIYAGLNGSLSYGYGRLVIIDHGKGLTTLYAHCHSISVAPGQAVSRGQNIALVGSTGSSTGPHLHFEVRVNGARQNPMGYF
ncbi:MAG: peptidoglycan DD-metalloendopeptidase family protein [Firmicutes bacterium]|nr:peptidoglycan DD-metalloendopeptidase family protein [Bacillota bacterium]